jgi:serine/threonine protein kinase
MSDEPGLETRTSSEKTGEGTVAPIGQIGAYTLIRTLGEGGMGTVYLAEQTTPVERRVALKVINLGMDTREIVARFEAERQALAVMDHPGIARVFDGGATDTGRPFFAMEFVQGIIHRDLKPSNVLVTLQDGQPAAKIIDFGIAKAIERPPDQTFATGVDQFVGTPAYMSPEQLGLTNQDVDTRADIYSLGVMLYELLAAPGPLNRPMGQRPTPRVTGPPRPFRDICAEGPAGVSRDSRRSSASKPRSTNSRLAEHDDGRARI